ncbi:SRPBCC domain-containing protein [Pseudonocardia sp. S2-4]|uniref:SRPBCC domain-containing protein n=1 Tax=Pseudonocardia humida TaxID=2800819 RepID=A0ABT1A294_9PSEU|nr:SRPBCC domain-containing protein [Pseudonocardia humida]
MGSENSKTRSRLLDATEQLMLEKGYAEVGIRSLARAAGVAPGLVLYYFRTLDDLLLAVLRRRADEELQRRRSGLADRHPLRALWDFGARSTGTTLLMEFIALGNHREVIGREIARYAEELRRLQLDALTRHCADHGLDPDELPPLVAVVLLTSISQGLVMERAIGMTTGHEETLALVERHMRRFDGGPTATPLDATHRLPYGHDQLVAARRSAVGFPDRIERTVEIAHPPQRVWTAITTAEGLAAWFGHEAGIDLRPGGAAWMKWDDGAATEMRVERVEEPTVFGFTWRINGLPEDDLRRTYVEFTLEPTGAGTRLTVVESGFAQLPADAHSAAFGGNTDGWRRELGELVAHLDAA